MSEARGLFDHRRDASEARGGRRIPPHLRLAEEPVPTPLKQTGGNVVRLVRDGWDYRERCGVRVWSHEKVNGGFFYCEEMAMRLNGERKG
jgi:hypothetical protein